MLIVEQKKRLILNTYSSLGFQIVSIICGFILPRLILKSYGSEINGLVNSISQFLAIISFLELGVGAVIQSSLYKPLADSDNISISKVVVSGQRFFAKLAFVFLMYVLLLIMIYPFLVEQNFGILYTATLILAISISSFAQYYFGIINRLLLIADQKGYVSYIAQIITLIMNTLACFVMIKLDANIHIVKLTTSLIYTLRPIILAIYVKKNYNINWKIKYDEEPIKQKWNGVAQHVSAFVLDGTDNIVLTIFANLKMVSIYTVYNIVTSGVKQLLLSMTNGIQSLMGELWAKQELVKLKNLFSWVEWVLHTSTILIFGITSALIVPFVRVYTHGVSDTNYIQPLFAILLVAANAGHCLRLPYNIMILVGGHYKQTQHCYIFAAVINIVISIVMVKKWGLVGVALGTVIAMFYQTVWMAIYNSRNFIKWPFKSFIKQIFVDIIIILLLHIFINFPAFSAWFEMKTISYISWIILAMKISVLGFMISSLINIFFYFSNIKVIVNKFVKK